jgi:hypothetical protein
MYTEQMTQALSFAGNPVFPQSGAPGTFDTGSIDMEKFRRAMFTVIGGALGASATLDFKLQVSLDNSTFTDLSVANPAALNYAITQITANNKMATLEIRAGQLPGAYRYVRARCTVGVAASQICTFALGGEAVDKPGSLVSDVLAVIQRQVVA